MDQAEFDVVHVSLRSNCNGIVGWVTFELFVNVFQLILPGLICLFELG